MHQKYINQTIFMFTSYLHNFVFHTCMFAPEVGQWFQEFKKKKVLQLDQFCNMMHVEM